MKALIALGLALLIASPLALLALDAIGVGPDFEAQAPDWKAGYTWEWDVTGRVRGSGEALMTGFEAPEIRSEATRRAEVLNTTLVDNGTPLRALLEAFRLERVQMGDEVLYDGADHRPDNDVVGDFGETFFCMTPCGTMLALYTEDGNPYSGTEAKEFLGSDRVRLLDFPMDRGKTWKVVSVQADEDVHFEIEAKAVTNEYVNLDGFDPFHSVRIEARLSDATKEAIKRMVRAEAEEEGVDVDMDFDIQMVYWYAPKAQNIIKIDLDGFMAVSAKGYGTAGSFRIDFHLDQVLSDYRLSAGPEQTMEEALARAEAAWANGGDTTTLSADRFRFQVGAEALEVRTADDSELFFGPVTGRAAAAADDEPQTDFADVPAGARVEWTHRYETAEGIQTERSTGDSARFSFDSPGLHTISAQVLDGQGRLMGADHVVVEAYQEETVTLDDPVGLVALTDQIQVPLQLASGATDFTVQLDPQAAARGTLTLQSDQGDMTQTGMTLDEATTVPVSFRAAGEYLVRWSDDARAGTLDMTVTVRYDRSGPTVGLGNEGQAPIWTGPSWLQRLA